MDNRNRGIPYRNPEGYTEWAAERAWQVEELKKLLVGA